MNTTKYNFEAYEVQAIGEFKELYPYMVDQLSEVQICDNGTIFIGNTEFKIYSSLNDFAL